MRKIYYIIVIISLILQFSADGWAKSWEKWHKSKKDVKDRAGFDVVDNYCEFTKINEIDVKEKIANAFNRTIDAIYKNKRFPECMKKDMEEVLPTLVVEYSCGSEGCAGACGFGGYHDSRKEYVGNKWKDVKVPNRHHVTLCEPNFLLTNDGKACGGKDCLEGLIAHELTHAAGYGLEGTAVDCSRIVFPCADDPEGDGTKDQSQCNCDDRNLKSGNMSFPGGDKPDDNSSYSTGCKTCKSVEVLREMKFRSMMGSYQKTYSITENVVYDEGFSNEAGKILRDNGEIYYTYSNTIDDLIVEGNTKVIVFPTGSLFSHQNDISLKETLKQYVSNGGTIVVFAQQYGRQVENIIPVPDGEKLKVYGWREDQSCYNGSVYGSIIHPVLSSMVNDRASAAVDGYIDKYPEDSVVLLRRTKNRKPALLYYKYGEGTVILTTLYTDWGYAHSQASSSELNIVRDLLTFAKDTESEIPMYNLSKTKNPKIKLNLKLRNDTEYDAVKAKIRVLTPSRDKVVFEKEVSVNIGKKDEESGKAGEADIPFEFDFTDSMVKTLGVWHTEYELYDNEGNLIKMSEESESGRFSLYKTRNKYIPSGGIDAWLTIKNERVWWDEKPELTLHIKNYTDKEKSLNVRYEYIHDGSRPFGNIMVPAHGSVEKKITFDHNNRVTRYWMYLTDHHNYYKRISKGFFIKRPETKSTVKIEGGYYQKYGNPISFKVESTNQLSRGMNVGLRVDIVNECFFDGCNFIKTVYSKKKELVGRESFKDSGSFMPSGLTPGNYRLKFTVEKPDGTREVRYRSFEIEKSRIMINIRPAIYPFYSSSGWKAFLLPGNEYNIKFILKNRGSIDVEHGKIKFSLKNIRTGKEMFLKEIKDIKIKTKEEAEVVGTFVYNPEIGETYKFHFTYEDETYDKPEEIPYNVNYSSAIYCSLKKDKKEYQYPEKAKIYVDLRGAGKIHVILESNELGLKIERDVELNENNNYFSVESFDIPLIYGGGEFASVFNLKTHISDDFGNTGEDRIKIIARSLNISVSGAFDKEIPQEGKKIGFKLGIKRVSGFIIPLPATLRVYSSELGIDESRSINILPDDENIFEYNIDIPEGIGMGYNKLNYEVKSNNILIKEGSFMINIPPSDILIKEPGKKEINSGEKIKLGYENIGGKNGIFEIKGYVYDIRGKRIKEFSLTKEIKAGESFEHEVEIPEEVLDGEYIVVRKVTEKNTNITKSAYDKIIIKGVNLSFKTKIDKKKYFDNEKPEGESDISSGQGKITDGKLKTEIYRMVKERGKFLFKPGRFGKANRIKGGIGKGGKLYLITEAGFIKYNPSIKAFDILNKDITNGDRVYFDSEGNIWVNNGWNGGVYKRDVSGNWTKYTTANGLLSDMVYDMIEYEDSSGAKSIWFATNSGISVLKSGNWSSYKTSDGLPSNYIYKFGKDEEGKIWVSTGGGVVRFTGTSFEAPSAPFGNGKPYFHMTDTTTGELWFIVGGKIYRYKSGVWKEWNLDDIMSGIHIYEMRADDDSVWFMADKWDNNSYVRYIIRYKDDYNFFGSDTIYKLNTVKSIIPYEGEGIYFVNSFGYIGYDGNSWVSEFIEIDMDKILDDVNCFAFDREGKLWLGTRSGISIYDGEKYENRVKFKDDNLIGVVRDMKTASDGKIYALTESEIVIFDGDTESKINLSDETREGNHLEVDTLSRVWVLTGGEVSYLSYYDGSWHEYAGELYYTRMVSDNSGGVWFMDSESIVHVKSDLSEERVNYPTGVYAYNVEKIFVDSKGRFWLISGRHYFAMSRSLDSNKKKKYRGLYLYDGSSWIDYSSNEGYPEGGVYNITEAGNKKIFVIGVKPPEYPLFSKERLFDIYEIRDGKFIKTDSNFNMREAIGFIENKGCFYVNVGELYGETGVLKISGVPGLYEKLMWSKNYPVNINSGGSVSVEHKTETEFPPGSYVIRGTLYSSLGQNLSESEDRFIVRGSDVSLNLSREGEYPQYLKKGDSAEIKLSSFNNTTEDKQGLSLEVKMVLPDGTEESVESKSIDILKGTEYTETIGFDKTEKGIYKIKAEIKEGDKVLSESEYLIEVTKPEVEVKTITPEYATDDEFPVKIKLRNTGKIPVNVNLSVAEINIDENVILKPGEEKLIEGKDKISSDKTYNLEISGDLSKSESFIVKYGYREVLDISVAPEYREGAVSVGYTLKESEGLPFREKLYFKLYSIGGTTPLYEFVKTYNVYPGGEGIKDSVSFNLLPGKYILKYKTDRGAEQEREINVMAAGKGVLTFTPAANYPVGETEFSYKLKNTDSVSGNIGLTVFVKKGDKTVFSENRSYYLDSGKEKTDYFTIKTEERGEYEVEIKGVKLTNPFKGKITVLPIEEYSAAISVEEIEGSRIPIKVNLNNSGFSEFNGTIVAQMGERRITEDLKVAGNSADTATYYIDTEGLMSGEYTVNVIVFNEKGEKIAEKSVKVRVKGPQIEISDFPEDLEIKAGGYAKVPLKVENNGNHRGSATLRVRAFDILDSEFELTLEAGEEKEIDGIYIDVPEGVSEGIYPFKYELKGEGVEGGYKAGKYDFKVKGIKFDVETSLDKDLYSVGDKAILTLRVNSNMESESEFKAIVNWGEFSEEKYFKLNGTEADLTFEIPIDTVREGKLFYGIYYKEGKGIYLNDLYLNISGAVSVVLDKQVYNPGDNIRADFTLKEPGKLTAEAFGERKSFTGTSGSLTFTVPDETLGGTYAISWSYEPSGENGELRSGSKSFDVAGLVVKTAEVILDKDKYQPSDTVKSSYKFESNRDVSLELRTWIEKPSGEWEWTGGKEITLKSEGQSEAEMESRFETKEAGVHKLIYGVYRGDELVVSGTVSFMCGDSFLMGVKAEKREYKGADKDVKVSIEYFGKGSGELSLYLDDDKMEKTPVFKGNVNMDGYGVKEVIISKTKIKGGKHKLKAVLKQSGLISVKESEFSYGTELCDLSVSYSSVEREGLRYKYRVEVMNSGKRVSGATSLVFRVDGVEISRKSVKSLNSGESVNYEFEWNGIGKAGDRKMEFEVDPDDSVKEYNEDNNSLEFTENIPAVFYRMEVEPEEWSANTEVMITGRLINNNNKEISLKAITKVINDSTEEVVFVKEREVKLPAFNSTVFTETFNTGVYPAGGYRVEQSITGDETELEDSRYIILKESKSLSAELELLPNKIGAGIDSVVKLKIKLKNTGNTPIEDEIVKIIMENKESGEIVKSDEIKVSLGISEEKEVEKTESLNLEPGVYEVKMEYQGKEIVSMELEVIKVIKGETGISVVPKVLLMNFSEFMCINSRTFIKKILRSGKLDYEDSRDIMDSYLKYEKGENTINIMFDNIGMMDLNDEIRERVFRGEGLIMIASRAGELRELKDMFGVRLMRVPVKKRERFFKIIEGSEKGKYQLNKNSRLMLKIISGDVKVLAKSVKYGYPVITERKYGKGRVVVISHPLILKSGMRKFSNFVLWLINRLNAEIYTESGLERIIPIDINIINQTDEEREIGVKVIFPYGVKGFGYNPKPANYKKNGGNLFSSGFFFDNNCNKKEDEKINPEWKLKLGAGEEKRIRYWLGIEDRIGVYKVKTEIKEGDNSVFEKELTFEITEQVIDRINRVIRELENLDIAGPDLRYVKRAERYLKRIRDRREFIGEYLKSFMNLSDAIKAGKMLGKVNSVDIGDIRREIGDLIIVYARKNYEFLKDLPSFDRNFFIKGNMMKKNRGAGKSEWR